MRQILYAIGMLMLVTSVLAQGDDLDPKSLTMAKTDVRVATYCVDSVEPADAVLDIVIDPICRDTNAMSGCQPVDTFDPTDFSVTPASPTLQLVGGAGCIDLVLETDNAEGLYYYTVNGDLSSANITSETGKVFVPEFGIVASVGLLGLAGVYIARRRKSL